jgi:hypothetical protein
MFALPHSLSLCTTCFPHFDPNLGVIVTGVNPGATPHTNATCRRQNGHRGGNGFVVGGGHGKPCSFCFGKYDRRTGANTFGFNPTARHHTKGECTFPQNPKNQQIHQGGGVVRVVVVGGGRGAVAAQGGGAAQLVPVGGGQNVQARVVQVGGGSSSPSYGTIQNGQFWNGKGWRKILNIDHRGKGTLVTYRRYDGVPKQVQI